MPATQLILLRRLLLDVQVTHLLSLHALELVLFPPVVVQCVTLRHGLLRQLLVFGVDVALNLLHIAFGVDVSRCLVRLQLLLEVLLTFFGHLGKGDINTILLFLDSLFKALTILPDDGQLRLVLGFLLADLLHLVQIFLQLRQLRIKVLDLLFCRCIQLLDLALVDLDRLRSILLILLFQQLDLRLQLEHLAHRLVVLHAQLPDDILLLLGLFTHGVLQALDVVLQVQNSGVFLLDQLVQQAQIAKIVNPK